jgi:hypothetical protein
VNELRGGRIREVPPEEITLIIIYEIEGRGRGYGATLSFLAAEHHGAGATVSDLANRGGLHWDPSLERAVSEAAGGVHLIFEAADLRGTEGVRTFMNANISRANSQFTFGYDDWQIAREVDMLIRHDSSQRQLQQAFTTRGNHNSATNALRQGQENINRAIDTSLSPEQRMHYGQLANQHVLLLSQIGREFDISPAISVLDDMYADYRPIFDTANPQRGLMSGTWVFHETCIHVTGVVAPVPSPAPSGEPRVVFQGVQLNFDLPILNRGGRTFYPMRQLLEALGAEVYWNNATRTATGILGERTVEFDIDSTSYRVNGQVLQMEIAAFIEDGRTYIPVRFAAEGLGFTVGWNDATQTLTID